MYSTALAGVDFIMPCEHCNWKLFVSIARMVLELFLSSVWSGSLTLRYVSVKLVKRYL